MVPTYLHEPREVTHGTQQFAKFEQLKEETRKYRSSESVGYRIGFDPLVSPAGQPSYSVMVPVEVLTFTTPSAPIGIIHFFLLIVDYLEWRVLQTAKHCIAS